MRIFVTGAAGFIAYHLLHDLLLEGHQIVGIDNLISGRRENVFELLTKYKSNFEFIESDILDYEFANAQKFDQIYHLACPAAPIIYQTNMLHTLDTCYAGSRKLLELAKNHNSKILLASTSEIYGDPLVHPQPESYCGNVVTTGPRSCYDEGKRVMETLGYVYRTQYGVDVRIARIFNTYGPKMNPEDGRVLNNFISQALNHKNLTIYGTGMQTRSFCYVSDTVRGLKLLMASEISDPVNLGSQYEISIQDIANKVISIINPNLSFEYCALPKDDPKMRRPDTTLAYKKLNWQTEVSLDDGIKNMIEDFKDFVEN